MNDIIFVVFMLVCQLAASWAAYNWGVAKTKHQFWSFKLYQIDWAEANLNQDEMAGYLKADDLMMKLEKANELWVDRDNVRKNFVS